ncbi:hypothetical protein MARA_12150 [Mycolicibacterium arabiense]|uniref:Uncharacterized protein n=1 Tax=Mycolicibacterium arabiense TaxID=1286181 RepID=A0A7I7RT67_9MYCO|nr:hypothetical protein MARA_12150 [Mycolicibacterium arabiense]
MRAHFEPPAPVRRPKPARGDRQIFPADVAVLGDPRNGVVDVVLDPGGADPVETVTLTVDLVAALHVKLGRKLAQLQENP